MVLIVSDAFLNRPDKRGKSDESGIVDDRALWPLLEALVHGKLATDAA